MDYFHFENHGQVLLRQKTEKLGKIATIAAGLLALYHVISYLFTLIAMGNYYIGSCWNFWFSFLIDIAFVAHLGYFVNFIKHPIPNHYNIKRMKISMGIYAGWETILWIYAMAEGEAAEAIYHGFFIPMPAMYSLGNFNVGVAFLFAYLFYIPFMFAVFLFLKAIGLAYARGFMEPQIQLQVQPGASPSDARRESIPQYVYVQPGYPVPNYVPPGQHALPNQQRPVYAPPPNQAVYNQVYPSLENSQPVLNPIYQPSGRSQNQNN